MKPKFVFTIEIDEGDFSEAKLEIFDKTGPALMSIQRRVNTTEGIGSVLEGMMHILRVQTAHISVTE